MKKYAPSYPEPPAKKTDVVVRFTAKKSDVALVARVYVGDDEDFKPGEIGSFVFQQAVKDARSQRR